MPTQRLVCVTFFNYARVGLALNFRVYSYIKYNFALRRSTPRMTTPLPLSQAKEVFIQGITKDGKTFRPSDWAERLAGVMSQFRPDGGGGDSHLSYSPWCLPTNLGQIKCVVVHPDLRDAEPMAWDFVMNFAKDNGLVVTEACLLPTAR